MNFQYIKLITVGAMFAAFGLNSATAGVSPVNSALCTQNAALCANGARGAALECAIGIISAKEVNKGTLALCAVEFAVESGKACFDMVANCRETTERSRLIIASSPWKGAVTGTTEELTCGQSPKVPGLSKLNRVSGIYTKTVQYYGLTLVSSILMKCIDGTTKEFVRNAGNSGTKWSGADCTAGRAVQGLSASVGNWLDALGPICDRVSTNQGGGDDIDYGPFGGGGGSATSMMCAEGYHVWGLRVASDTSLPLNKRFVNGLAPICAKWTYEG